METQYPSILWRGRTKTSKTGDMPTAYVGKTRQESLDSCKGCPLLPTKECYSQFGTPSFGHAAMAKKVARVGEVQAAKDYSLKTALANRSVAAKYIRFTSIGEGSRCDPVELVKAERTVREAGLGWIAYGHFAIEIAQKKLQHLFVASLPTKGLGERSVLEQADYVIDELGFNRVAAVLPWDYLERSGAERTFRTPEGKLGIICPAQWAHAMKRTLVTCNQCGLCDPAKPGPYVIGFIDHSRRALAKIRSLAQRGVQWAINFTTNI